MRVIVASVRTPFIRGGAEVLADELTAALIAAGHQAELVQVPFNAADPERIPDQMLACALMNLDGIDGQEIDRLIALKFPAYLIPHHHKVVWLLHQYRAAYDLWEHPLGNLRTARRGPMLRDIIRRADAQLCSEVKAFFTLSSVVTQRLRKHWNVDSIPLHHPPAYADAFYCAEAEDYIFFPSRLAINKRQELALEALALTRSPVRLKFAGSADSSQHFDYLKETARKLGIGSRVEWLGFLSEEQKRDAYARALAVLFPPFDEDYGYVTLEAMLASKPIITCNDSGGPLEFVVPDETGIITPPTAEALAAAMDKIWSDRVRAERQGEAGRKRYQEMGLSWSNVVRQLTA